jgi:chromosome segregation ATPase
MIEPIMYFGIGFLVAALLGLLFVPLVHERAVRLTMRRLEAATPLSIAEIRADKDQLRAEFAMSTRRLEMSVEQMKAKTTGQLAELGKKTDAIIQLKKELGDKTATIFELESRERNLRDQLRATEEEFKLKSGSLHGAERVLADKEAELAKLLAELGERAGRGDEGQRCRL